MENKSNVKLSIIVPVYNTEQYLRECLSSILEQNTDRSLYEVIVVNDGTPDNSQLIIDEFCSTYNNVWCIVQDNQGLSMARNNGVAAAGGDYVWFVDSDDWVEPNSIKSILAECDYEPEVISIKKVKSNTKYASECLYAKTGQEILLSKEFEHGAVYYILNRQFMRKYNLRFMERIYHEDSEFTPRSLYYADRVRVIAQPLYNVRINPNSITRSINPKKSYDLLVVANSLSEFRRNVVREVDLQKLFDILISICLNKALLNILESDSKAQQMFNNKMREQEILLSSLWRCSFKKKMEYLCFKLFPGYYSQVYKILKRL